MTPNSTLEIKGTADSHSFVEVLAEIGRNKLTGALRAASEPNKAIIYFNNGKLVFAVSNARKHRLFDMLLQKGRITKEELVKHPQFAIDPEFIKSLLSQNVMKQDEIDALTSDQVKNIVSDVLEWAAGEWSFDPRARTRTEIAHQFDLDEYLLNYARSLSAAFCRAKLADEAEFFSIPMSGGHRLEWQPHETFILSNLSQTRSLKEMLHSGGIAEDNIYRALYTLWSMGGIERSGRQRAFAQSSIDAIRSAIFTRKAETPQPKKAEAAPPKIEPKAAEIEISLDDYLKRVQNAESHYNVLGLEQTASIVDIKRTYFGLAKLFHPDHYHRESPQLLRSVQTAFTALSQAYETLRQPDTRQTYDFKLRKEDEERAKRIAEGKPETNAENKLAEGGMESYEQGLKLLKEENYEEAATHFARAVHYAPGNALFHAYYGQALSFDDRQIRKAEAELQTAIKMEPANEEIRLMLVDFFLDINMAKRAEGELKRFLEIVPNSTRARQMLAELQQ